MKMRSRAVARWFFITTVSLSTIGGPAQVSAQETCSARSEWELPGIVKDVSTQTAGAQDWKITQAQVSKIVSQAQGLIDLLLRLDYVAHPMGMQVGYYRAVGSPGPDNMTLKTQPYPLHVEAMVFGFACINGKVARRWTDADAGLTIDVNSLFNILDNTGATINGKKAYMLKFDLGEYRGYRLFMPYTNNPKDQSRYERSILVTRPGKLPFTYVTRKEVLDYLRAEVESAALVEAQRAGSTVTIRPREEQEAAKKRRVEEIQGYSISEDAKKKRIERYLADLKSDEQLRDEAVAKATAISEARRKRLDKIQSGYTEAELREPAVIPAQTGLDRTRLDSEDWGFVSPKIDLNDDCYPRCKFGQYLVTLNENHYDKSLPPTAFQFFVFTVGSTGDPKDMCPDRRRIRDESLASFDLEALAAMLGK